MYRLRNTGKIATARIAGLLPAIRLPSEASTGPLLKLCQVHLSVQALLTYQLIMSTLLNDTSVFHNKNQICISDELRAFLNEDVPKLSLEEAKFRQSLGLNEWDPLPEGVEY